MAELGGVAGPSQGICPSRQGNHLTSTRTILSGTSAVRPGIMKRPWEGRGPYLPAPSWGACLGGGVGDPDAPVCLGSTPQGTEGACPVPGRALWPRIERTALQMGGGLWCLLRRKGDGSLAHEQGRRGARDPGAPASTEALGGAASKQSTRRRTCAVERSPTPRMWERLDERRPVRRVALLGVGAGSAFCIRLLLRWGRCSWHLWPVWQGPSLLTCRGCCSRGGWGMPLTVSRAGCRLLVGSSRLDPPGTWTRHCLLLS